MLNILHGTRKNAEVYKWISGKSFVASSWLHEDSCDARARARVFVCVHECVCVHAWVYNGHVLKNGHFIGQSLFYLFCMYIPMTYRSKGVTSHGWHIALLHIVWDRRNVVVLLGKVPCYCNYGFVDKTRTLDDKSRPCRRGQHTVNTPCTSHSLLVDYMSALSCIHRLVYLRHELDIPIPVHGCNIQV
jgi:hypothetical protein